MELISGTEMLKRFGGLHSSMKALQEMTDGQFHLKVTWRCETFQQSGNPNDVLSAFTEWLKRLSEAENAEK